MQGNGYYYRLVCGSDWCNSALAAAPAFGLVLVLSLLLIHR
jgi:hypothetical protein